ncbi:hypothetical protein DFH06DRAFT_997536, partial [Mycena polygramma]
CAKTYTVVSGDTCAAIEKKTGVSDAQLHQLNPSINSGCTNLQIGESLCVGGSTGGGCSQTYTVVSGDTCAAIEKKTGVSDAQLHAQNPSINSGCTSRVSFSHSKRLALNVFPRSANRRNSLRQRGIPRRRRRNHL